MRSTPAPWLEASSGSHFRESATWTSRSPIIQTAMASARPALPLLMAEGAIQAGLFRAMAVHAAAHGDVALTRQLSPFRDRPMTFLAGIARVEMAAMAKVHVAWDLVDADPLDLALILGKRGELLNC